MDVGKNSWWCHEAVSTSKGVIRAAERERTIGPIRAGMVGPDHMLLDRLNLHT